MQGQNSTVTTDASVAEDLRASLALAQRSQPAPQDTRAIEAALIGGDLSKLTPEQRVKYYNAVCQSLGLNPLTKPFAYITLNGKLALYALKDATEQLRNNRDISIDIKAREVIEGCYVVTAQASMPHGRHDESTGVVPIEKITGEARANAMLKAETKAKRRVTLSICGLGMLDETEVESIAPSYTVAAAKRIDLPLGTAQILTVEPGGNERAQWATVTYVDAAGVEHSAKCAGDPRGGAAALAEQLAQEGCPVNITTRVNRNNATVIDQLRRWTPEPTPEPREPGADDVL